MPETIDALINLGANTKLCNDNDCIHLMIASQYSNTLSKIVKILIDTINKIIN